MNNKEKDMIHRLPLQVNKKEIFLAGGCFWGVQEYIRNLPGVEETQVGYANGKTENPTYEDVCFSGTGHAETVQVLYNPAILPLDFLITKYFDIIDPTSINQQGNDTGLQYRTGIYYTNENDLPIIKTATKQLAYNYKQPITVEIIPLENYYPAEKYHQDYLQKNPGGYCHIPLSKFTEAKNAYAARSNSFFVTNTPTYRKPDDKQLHKILTPRQYAVTQQNATEPAFKNEYYNEFRSGIYVDITTRQPLFVSSDKFDSGCGWPAFSKPIDESFLKTKTDTSAGMERTEVRSATGDAHLGHVFNDGPAKTGGLRYCINSAALRFIPKEKMEEEGYGAYIKYIKL